MKDTIVAEIHIPAHGKNFVFTTDSLHSLCDEPSKYYICSCGTLQKEVLGKRKDIVKFNGVVKLESISGFNFFAHFNNSKLTTIILK